MNKKIPSYFASLVIGFLTFNALTAQVGLSAIPTTNLFPPFAPSDFQVRFDFEQNYGVKQITVNGEPLLTGCGFGFIGSASGDDNGDNITTCLHGNGGVMRPFSGSTPFYLPHQLQFTLDPKDSTRLNFGGEIGPSPYDFSTVSMPMDAQRTKMVYFRYPGSDLKNYDEAPFAYNYGGEEKYPVYIYGAGDNKSWGEVISNKYTIRVTITNASKSMPLFFVKHPDTKNVEFSFGHIGVGEKVNVNGYIQVFKNPHTDPSYPVAFRTRANYFLNSFDSKGTVSAKPSISRNPLISDEIFTMLDLNGNALLSGDKVMFRTRAGYYLNSFDSSGAVSAVPNANTFENSSDEVFTIVRVAGDGLIQQFDKVYIKTRSGYFFGSSDSRGPVSAVPSAHPTWGISDEQFEIQLNPQTL